MHKLTFFPLGNADCCLIDIESKAKLLIDYAHTRSGEDEDDPRIDLARVLRDDLEEAERDYYDVVAFTHADDDHIRGATDFFELKHAKKYQGGERIAIRKMWVPAQMILEPGLTGEARVLREEARFRLKQGDDDVRVFSRPGALEEWLNNEGLSLDARRHLITDAGQFVPGFDSTEVEFFAHSPFSKEVEGVKQQRNAQSIVIHASFWTGGQRTCLFLGADTTYDNWQDIVNITEYKKRKERLEWDVFKLPHHTSYTSISDQKGQRKTQPVSECERLFGDYGQQGCYLISTSDPIPDDYSLDLPPHPQTANYYREVGDYRVTMEYPTRANPDKMIIEIDSRGARLVKSSIAVGATLTSRTSPRAG